MGYLTDTPEAMKFWDQTRFHIECVKEAGYRLGVPTAQLVMHDNSKFTIPEWFAYVNHFIKGDRSPEAETAFAYAWNHHIHENQHHPEHWIFKDENEPGTQYGILEMPENYALEMVADWMAASRCYTGSWDMQDWLTRRLHKIILHPRTKQFVCKVLVDLGYHAEYFDGIYGVLGITERSVPCSSVSSV